MNPFAALQNHVLIQIKQSELLRTPRGAFALASGLSQVRRAFWEELCGGPHEGSDDISFGASLEAPGHGNDDVWPDNNGPLYGGIRCFLSHEGFVAATDPLQGKTLNKDMLLKTHGYRSFLAEAGERRCSARKMLKIDGRLLDNCKAVAKRRRKNDQQGEGKFYETFQFFMFFIFDLVLI